MSTLSNEEQRKHFLDMLNEYLRGAITADLLWQNVAPMNHDSALRDRIAAVSIKDPDTFGILINKPLEEVVGSEVIDKIMKVMEEERI